MILQNFQYFDEDDIRGQNKYIFVVANFKTFSSIKLFKFSGFGGTGLLNLGSQNFFIIRLDIILSIQNDS